MVIFAILLGVLPSLIWLIFFLKEDVYPEPKGMLAKVFIWGSIAAFMALIFQYFFQDILGFFKISEYTFTSFFVLAAIEEVLKFAVVYAAINKSKYFDEPIDAMIYMITAALGFAALENIFLALGNLSENGLISSGIFTILTMRFIGATLLHALSSGIVGYYWIKAKIFKGIVIATFLHAVFNYLILMFNNTSALSILIYPLFFLIIIALVVFKDFEKVKI